MIGMAVLSSTNLQHLCLQRLRAHDGQAKQGTLTSEFLHETRHENSQGRGDILPGGGAHSGLARWWRDHKDVEDQIK